VALVGGWLAFVLAAPAPLETFKDEVGHALTLYGLAEGASLEQIWFADRGYPPLYYLLAVASSRLLGSVERVALALPHLVALLGAAALLASLLRSAGQTHLRALIGAAVLGLSLLPTAWQMTPDMTLVATVMLGLWALERVHRAPTPLGLLGLGGALLAAALSREYAPIYLAVPILIVAVRAEERRHKVALLAVAVGAGLLSIVLFHGHFGLAEQLDHAGARASLWSQVVPAVLGRPRLYGGALLSLFLAPLLLLVISRPRADALVAALAPIVLLLLFPAIARSYLVPAYGLLILACLTSSPREGRTSRVARVLLVLALIQPAWAAADQYGFATLYHERAEGLSDALAADLAERCPSGCKVFVLFGSRGHAANRVKVDRLRRDVPWEVVDVPPMDYVVVARETGDRNPSRTQCLSAAAWERMVSESILLSPQALELGPALVGGARLLASFGEDPTWHPADPHGLSVCAPPR